MATQFRFLCKSPFSAQTLTSLFTRTFSSSSSTATAVVSLRRPLFLRLLPCAIFNSPVFTASVRAYSTRRTSSSLNDPNPNWSNRPPKETILLDGCDFNHWLVVMEKPEGDTTRDEIIDSYIKTLAMVVGSEEEARMKIYSVSTKHYFAFGALVSEELSYKIKELPRVRWVLPDSYLDVKNKDYGGEPFINGEAVPYDPKYHEEWVRNNAKAQERNRRNDRPRANDRSRNFNRRRENMLNQDVQYSPPSPMPNQGMPNSAPNMSRPPQGNMSGPPQANMGGPTQGNMGGSVQGNFGGGGQPPFPSSNAGGFPQNNGPPPSYSGYNNSGMQQNYYRAPGGPPAQNNYNSGSGFQPNNMVQPPPTAGWSNNPPGANVQNNYPNSPNSGAMPYQGPPQNYQTGPSSGGMPYQGPPQNHQNSFIPGRD